MNFGEAPGYYRRFVDPIGVACIKTAPMDTQGYFNFGCSTTYLRAMTERARVIVVETSQVMPRVPGPDNAIHSSQVDYVIEGDAVPLPEISAGQVSAVERQVARLIAAEIDDGACLQIGIGGMPNGVCSLLREANVRNLGIHTEMLVDGIADLIEAGIVTNSCKQIDRGRSVFSFALGSGKLYRRVRLRRRLHKLAGQHFQKRQGRVDKQHDADRSAGTGSFRVLWISSRQWHRRATAIRARCVRLQRRQIFSLPVVNIRKRGSANESDCHHVDARKHSDHTAYRYHVCGDRVRDRQPQGQICGRTRHSTHFNCSP
jgi:hypothetical protein